MAYYYPYYSPYYPYGYVSAIETENALRRSRLAAELAVSRVAT